MSSSSRHCDRLTRHGQRCKNYRMQNHPCCKAHIRRPPYTNGHAGGESKAVWPVKTWEELLRRYAVPEGEESSVRALGGKGVGLIPQDFMTPVFWSKVDKLVNTREGKQLFKTIHENELKLAIEASTTLPDVKWVPITTWEELQARYTGIPAYFIELAPLQGVTPKMLVDFSPAIKNLLKDLALGSQLHIEQAIQNEKNLVDFQKTLNAGMPWSITAASTYFAGPVFTAKSETVRAFNRKNVERIDREIRAMYTYVHSL